jgi:tetratricopeptide (TPR) repeat protein
VKARVVGLLAGVCLVAGLGAALLIFTGWRYSDDAALRGLVESGRLTEAGERAKDLVGARPDAPSAWRWSATCHRLAGRLEQAAEALDRALGLEREISDDLVAERALLRATGGDLEGTKGFLRAWAASHPGEAWQAELALAKGCLMRFRGQQALHHLDRWVEAAPGNPYALAERGKAKAWLMAYQEAARDLEASLSAGVPAERDTRSTLARCLLETSQPGRAMECLRPLLEGEGTEPGEIRLGVLCSLELGDQEGAERLLGRLLENPASNPEGMARDGLLQARVEMARGERADWARVESLLRRVTVQAPGDHEAVFLWIRALHKAGREGEAGRAEERLAKLEAAYARIQRIQRGEMDKAPLDPALHAEVGALLESVGNRAEALGWYRSALAIDPGHAEAARGVDRLGRAGASAIPGGPAPK